MAKTNGDFHYNVTFNSGYEEKTRKKLNAFGNKLKISCLFTLSKNAPGTCLVLFLLITHQKNLIHEAYTIS